jgi:hypothetical protein
MGPLLKDYFLVPVLATAVPNDIGAKVERRSARSIASGEFALSGSP